RPGADVRGHPGLVRGGARPRRRGPVERGGRRVPRRGGKAARGRLGCADLRADTWHDERAGERDRGPGLLFGEPGRHASAGPPRGAPPFHARHGRAPRFRGRRAAAGAYGRVGEPAVRAGQVTGPGPGLRGGRAIRRCRWGVRRPVAAGGQSVLQPGGAGVGRAAHGGGAVGGAAAGRARRRDAGRRAACGRAGRHADGGGGRGGRSGRAPCPGPPSGPRARCRRGACLHARGRRRQRGPRGWRRWHQSCGAVQGPCRGARRQRGGRERRRAGPRPRAGRGPAVRRPPARLRLRGQLPGADAGGHRRGAGARGGRRRRGGALARLHRVAL
ncbi:unnamed protein product, partial [Prorocentrum cordatum]